MTLEAFNSLTAEARSDALKKCCGSAAWVHRMMQQFSFSSVEELLTLAEREWRACSTEDWKEAFSHHPKIGDLDSLKKKFASTSQWASGEQAGVTTAGTETLTRLQEGNLAYEKKFGYIFIVCATGKSAEEMLGLLDERLANAPSNEIHIAMEEQLKITLLRLKKILS